MTGDEILLNEAIRKIQRQEATVDLFRQRAGAMLGSSGVLAGLFALASGDVNGLHVWTKAFALLALVLLALLVVYIEWPRTYSLDIDLTAAVAFQQEALEPVDSLEASQAVLSGLHEAAVSNEKPLERLVLQYKIALVLVGVQIIAWGLTVA